MNDADPGFPVNNFTELLALYVMDYRSKDFIANRLTTEGLNDLKSNTRRSKKPKNRMTKKSN